ncbi:MAG TPA: hypothetical protein VNE63_12945 [Candidatus Acidoferrales bacterium]|nr:hypothetical protein [Candidatus Acidoferrales bacterium]
MHSRFPARKTPPAERALTFQAAAPLVSLLVAVLAVFPMLASSSLAQGLVFPLRMGTRWTYHLHQKNAPGVRFRGPDAALAKGNVLDATVISEVRGVDRIGDANYVRIESRRNEQLWMTEWYRVVPQGLFLGKTAQADEGSEVVMTPPQQVLNTSLQRGESWIWKSVDAPAVIRARVLGPDRVAVPAGSYSAVAVETDLVLHQGQATVTTREIRWFASGTGFVDHSTETFLNGHLLSSVRLTLEKFEPGS